MSLHTNFVDICPHYKNATPDDTFWQCIYSPFERQRMVMGSGQRCISAFLAGCSLLFLFEALKVITSPKLQENGWTLQDATILPSSVHPAPANTPIGHLYCSNKITEMENWNIGGCSLPTTQLLCVLEAQHCLHQKTFAKNLTAIFVYSRKRRT